MFAFFPKFSENLTQNLTTSNSFLEKMSLMKIVLKFDFPIKKMMSENISWWSMSMMCPKLSMQHQNNVFFKSGEIYKEDPESAE